jgi:hypothetical protein
MSHDGADETRLHTEAAALLAEAFGTAPYMRDAYTTRYSHQALIIEATPGHLRVTRQYLFERLDTVFRAAGWERRISTPNCLHAYVPGWLPRL